MAKSTYEHVWNALNERSSESRAVAFDEIDYAVKDPIERMVLRAMTYHELPKKVSRQDGIASVAQYVTENSVRVHTNLAAMDIAIAFPNFFDGPLPNDLDILRPRTIGIESSNHFAVRGEHTTNSQLPLPETYQLRAHRVIRGTTNPEVARQIAKPEVLPNVSLIIGYEAVKAYASSVQEWANDFPDSPAPLQKRDILLAALGEGPDTLQKRLPPLVSLDD